MGSVHVSMNVAYDLLKASDEYLLDGLKRQCEHIIAQVSEVATLTYTLVCDIML